MAGSQTDGQCLLRIDKEGNWFYNDLPIINKAIYLFFNQHLTQDESGAYIVRIGNETSRLFVEDTPFVVTSIDYIQTKGPEDFFNIRLNDETTEKLDLNTLYIGKNNIPYCRAKEGLFPARFLRAAYYQLSQYVQQEGEDGFYIMLNGRKQYLYLPS